LENAVQKLIAVDGLTVLYGHKKSVPAVDDISFALSTGESAALVGESGSGKTTVALSLLGLFNRNKSVRMSGKIFFNGSNLLDLSESDLAGVRGREIGLTFQEPLLALNPLYTVGFQISEALKHHKVVSRRQAKQKAKELLRQVGMDAENAYLSYPHQLSGGMRQRAMLAVALSCRPKLLIADEPTSALDAPLREQILTMLSNLCGKENISLLLITHNIKYAATICHRILVLYRGRLVEDAPVDIITGNAAHPYSRVLFKLSQLGFQPKSAKVAFKQISENYIYSAGCGYYNCCPRRTQICVDRRPILQPLRDNNLVACWHPQE